MKHLGDIRRINGGGIEEFPVAVTKYHFGEGEEDI